MVKDAAITENFLLRLLSSYLPGPSNPVRRRRLDRSSGVRLRSSKVRRSESVLSNAGLEVVHFRRADSS